jgi:hypothetical protein
MQMIRIVGAAVFMALGVSIYAHAATSLGKISCQHNTFTGAGTDLCSVYMTGSVSSTDSIAVSSNNPNAVLSSSKVWVTLGHQSGGLAIKVASVTTTQKAVITATFGGKSVTYGITLTPATSSPAADKLGTITCQSSSFTSQGTDSCSVKLTAAATANDTVKLTSNDSNAVPTASVSIVKGSTSAAFSIRVAAVTTQQAATITATLGSSVVKDSLTLYPSSASAKHKVTLNWSAPKPNGVTLAGYHVYRSSGSNTTNFSEVSAQSATSYVDTNVTGGASYTYVVRSVDTEGVESSNSNSTVVTIPSP